MKHTAAIMRSVADVRILKNQFLAAAKAADESNRKRLENYRIAGIHLTEIKNVVGHRNFGPWLKENCNYSERQCQRWMKLAKSDTVADLESAWKSICGRDSESEEQTNTDDATTESTGEQADTETTETGTASEDSSSATDADASEDDEPETPKAGKGTAPKTVPAVASAEPAIPARIKPHFAAVPLFKDAAAKAVRLANILAEAEKTPAYKAVHEGQETVVYSSTVRMVATNYENDVPIRPCPDGCGEVEPSPDSDPCKLCGGKGYQTKDDIAHA